MNDDVSFSGFCDSLLDCLAQLCCCSDSVPPPARGTQPRSSTVSTAPLTVSPRSSRTRTSHDVESGLGFDYDPRSAQHITPITHQPHADYRSRSFRPSYPIRPIASTEQPQPKVITQPLPGVHRSLSSHSGPSTLQAQDNTVSEEFSKIDCVVDTIDESDLASSKYDQSASAYRDQAKLHFKRSNQFYGIANECRKRNNRERAEHYVRQAKRQKKLGDEANHRAAAAFLEENNKKHRDDTIDLHYLFVKEALQALDIFLDAHICSLQNEEQESKSLTVITGKGKHTADGIPRLKPAVMERFRERGLKFAGIGKDPGCFKVKISVDSYLTKDLPEA